MAKISKKNEKRRKKVTEKRKKANKLLKNNKSTVFKYLFVKNISLNAVKCDILCGVVVKDCNQWQKIDNIEKKKSIKYRAK